MRLSPDQRNGAILSAALHLALLALVAYVFRNPLSTQIVAAGEGQGGEGGAIEVGIVDAGQLSFTLPRAVSYAGSEPDTANNEVLETAAKNESEAEALAPDDLRKSRPRPDARLTERPVAPQNEQLYSKKPLLGGSPNTSVEVGRTFGTSMPAMSGGIGVGPGAAANPGASGLPGGSEYGRRIQMILSRNYNPPAIADAGAAQYVIVQLRIARDGRILSLANGRLSPAYLKKRSPNDLVNFAAERAIIASNPLPPFPNGFLPGAQEAVAEIWFRYPK